jgi:hypothetical protein
VHAASIIRAVTKRCARSWFEIWEHVGQGKTLVVVRMFGVGNESKRINFLEPNGNYFYNFL